MKISAGCLNIRGRALIDSIVRKSKICGLGIGNWDGRGQLTQEQGTTQAPAAFGHRGRRRRVLHPLNPNWALREGEQEADTKTFLERMQRKYRAAKSASARAALATCPPPSWSEGPAVVHHWLDMGCKHPDVIYPLYNPSEVPRRITSECLRTGQVSAKKAKRESQEEWLVEWEDSIVRKTHLDMYRLKTYKPVAVAEHDALGEPFMGGAGVLVTWEPTWEPKSTFEKLFPTVGAELIANYLREKERAAVAAATMAAAWPPPDVSTEERLAQQGLVAPPRPAWQLTRPDALSNITLDTMPSYRRARSKRNWSELLRRSAHTRTMKEDQMQRTYGGTHNELVAAVQAATGADTELFASPLDVHRNMPSYLSTHPRDQLFGAGMDAYSHRWVGACFAHPPEQPEELERAVRWALASAREADRHTPVLTVMLLPDNAALTAVDAAPHARWLAYPEVVDLACFPPSVAPLLAANDWTGAPPRFGSRQCTGHRLVAIGNNIGRERILRRDFGELWADLHRRIQLPVSFGLPWPWQQTDGQGPPRYNEQAYNAAVIQRAERYEQARKELTEQYRRPRKHATAASDTSSLWRWPPDGQASTLPPVAQLQQLYGSQQHRPRYEWRLAFFTDGSVQATEEAALVGAAVWHSTLGAYKINTNGDGPDNTITRAELAAIFCTVAQRLPRTDEGVIFTDSQAAIHLLHRAVHKPHTLEGHLHKELLLNTAQILVERANDGVRTRILKVKAHSGVTGNEEADAAAKAAAGADETHDFVMPAHKPFGGQWQPAFFEPPPEGAEGPASLRAVSNLTSALRKAVHASTKTGTSKHRDNLDRMVTARHAQEKCNNQQEEEG
ncbi:hypothetical protein CHLNCDRAFT_52244 [Chlorella variabilis]|uniref:RNase H type-1 domain-containing protein n=1 Tax=Chlorella variabilis TaxID=554065 RepID=E1ZF68_CHLVA|nr:hypothetical protein CHLNCDRAFT_52244 [Chlorella variabilis]EFN55447.1 hypothetical protein CHLNCDRAFT_52244 [Chlorella variabilis]|eukprot:XP_005847549.1 hypothetical protein CHLNCDRAFT_52244 [Chlorella variabilis]